jgi:two-component system NtrC family sensor kinase
VKLARKLIVAILLGMVVVLSVSGYLRVRRELSAFGEDMARDHALVARSLQSAIVSTWNSEHSPEAIRAVAEGATDERVRVRWLDAQTPAEPADSDWRVSRFPVLVGGTQLGTLEVSEARDEERAYVRKSVLQTVLSTAVLAVLALSMIIGLTLWFVGRPIRLLRDKMKRIGEGDLGGPLRLPQHDEIGELARETNVMCDRLAEARRLIETETEGRLRALEQLRHADRLATVGRLASGVAHELGTPLGVVLARARMFQDGEVLPGDISNYGRIIAEQVERMSGIIRQLLDFSRRQLRGDKAEAPDREPVDLGELVKRTLALVEPLAEKRQVRLTFQAIEAVEAAVHPGLVQQVVLNLVMNALQAMVRPGTVHLTLRHDRATAPAGVESQSGQYARLTVEDAGKGIDPEVLPRVFEPFFTTKDVGEGTGLGLSVSYGIIREHGGWIDVESQVGVGSRFSVFLPTAVAVADSQGGEHDQSGRNDRRERPGQSAHPHLAGGG